VHAHRRLLVVRRAARPDAARWRLARLARVRPAAGEVVAAHRRPAASAALLVVDVGRVGPADARARDADLLRVDRDDAPLLHPAPQPRDERRPHRVPRRTVDVARRDVGVQAVHEQDLGAVDVADPGEHRLVHERASDADAAPLERRPRALRVRVVTDRVGAEPRDDRVDLRLVEQLARGRADEVDGVPTLAAVRLDAVADRVARRRGRRARGERVVEHLAEQPEVDVHAAAVVVAVEEVLPERVGRDERAAVELRGGRVEAALRRGDADLAAGEPLGVVTGEPVDRVALGHCGS
jgi:hypothetical protein